MQKISALIIAYNEEENIRDCLESIKWADEIILIDAFSQDQTREICAGYGARVFKNEWPGYAKQRNFAQKQANHDWVIALDADERLSNELIKQIQEVLSRKDKDIFGYYIPRQTYYLGRWIKHAGWYPNYQLRLYSKDKGNWFGNNLHEYVKLRGKTARLKGKIIHYSYRRISAHLDKINNYSSILAAAAYREGKHFSFFRLIFRPVYKFLNTYLIKLGFLDRFPGLVIGIISSVYIFLQEAKLWELNRQKNK